MESTRPIRALIRGLEALTVLNLRDGATVSDVVGEIRLPRTTVYRILETLRDAGFVHRDGADDRYRLTVQVRGLSHGFDDEAWVTQIAKPHIDALCHRVVWPVSIASLAGTTMMVRETTDHASPLATERYSAGMRVPLLSSASGLVFIAHCSEDERDALLDALAKSGKAEDRPARARGELLDRLMEIRTQGYATGSQIRRDVEETTLAVPVRLGDQVLAALTVRFGAAAVSAEAVLDRLLPPMRDCAAKIGEDFSEHKTAARRRDAPETAV